MLHLCFRFCELSIFITLGEAEAIASRGRYSSQLLAPNFSVQTMLIPLTMLSVGVAPKHSRSGPIWSPLACQKHLDLVLVAVGWDVQRDSPGFSHSPLPAASVYFPIASSPDHRSS